MRLVFWIALALVGLFITPLRADPPVDYLRQIKPLLAARCYACHASLQQKGDLRADTVKFLRDGGSHGPALVPGKSGQSFLMQRVQGAGKAARMPPTAEGEGLSETDIALLKAWIDQGATGPNDEKPQPDPREHWAFRGPVRPAIPKVNGLGAMVNPIDAFLALEMAKRGLKPQPPADKRILLRRVYLDLIGLPPTAEELSAFEADKAPDAYLKVVDRLLASKQYGERWGRHWMDVWRYSDWWGLGAEVRNSQKHMWHWRDWIIEAVNSDKGYDQMIREMLAADELYPNDLDRLRATGFLVRPYFLFNRNTWLDETIEHTGKAFVGLTFNCARCHDHKYDPISQQDYFRFRAFFEPYQVRLDQLPGETDYAKDGLPRVFDCNLDAPTFRFERGDEKRPLKRWPLSPGLPALLTFAPLKVQPVPLPAEAQHPGLRAFVLENYLKQADQRIAAGRTALRDARRQLAESAKVPSQAPASAKPLEAAKSAAAPNTTPLAPDQARMAVTVGEKALAVAELQPALLRARWAADQARFRQPAAADATTLTRAAAKLERESALAQAEENLARAELAVLQATAANKAAAEQKRTAARAARDQAHKAIQQPGDSYTSLKGAVKSPENNLENEASRAKPFPSTSTGRRTALAQWITDPRHPLTARVAVNHVWLRHFGKPLVPNAFEFGRRGAAPSHPELVDFLAVELIENHWSLKHLHRLMVTSDAYRRSSSSAHAFPANIAVDSDNRWYWRMNPVRMQAQVIRDSLLALAGELDLTMGGPALDPVSMAGSRRRSLYFVHSHNDHHKFLSQFDDASVLECYRRSESIVPQQALTLSNSQFALQTADKINARLHQRLGSVSDAVFARTAFETILAGHPSNAELEACEQSLAELNQLLEAQKTPNAKMRARASLIQALLNHNDFVTIR